MLSSRYWFVVGVILLAGCGGRSKVVTLPAPIPARMGNAEEGMASWYGNPYHGRRTSNGEIYDMDQLTAAHLSLPFDTWVRVTNLENGRSVDLRINDRGPFLKNRVIDLSRAGARAIGMIGPGTARVRVEVVGVPGKPYEADHGQQVAHTVAPTQVLYSPAGTPLAVGDSLASAGTGTGGAADPDGCQGGPFFAVQVGSFREFDNAERMRGKMQELYGVARLIEVDNSQGALYRVIVGQAGDGAEAQRLLEHLSHDRFDGYVLRVDAASRCL
jgi:peptidoglycan lytic transglycosylase